MKQSPQTDEATAAPPTRRCALRRHCLIGLACGALAAIAWHAVYVFLGANFHCIEPGMAYRSAQPSAIWLRHVIEQKGIRSVINLRGEDNNAPWYLNERRIVLDSGGYFENVMLSAAVAPEASDLQRLVRVLDEAPRPVLVHCHSGADRTGLVATLFLLLYTDTPMDEARQQLAWRYGHVACGRSACLQKVLDQYEAWLSSQQSEHRPELLREWIAYGYRKPK